MKIEKKKKGSKGGRGCRVLASLFLMLALSTICFAQDDISISTGIIGNGKKLGAKTYDSQTTIGVIGIDSNNDTAVFAPSGEQVVAKVALTPQGKFNSSGSTLKTTLDTVAGAGTTVSDAAALSSASSVHRLTGANGTVGWKFTTGVEVNDVHFLLGTTAGVIKVYGESGSTCNGGSADTACTLTTGILPHICVKTALLTYICA
jgi:hypothetical protein